MKKLNFLFIIGFLLVYGCSMNERFDGNPNSSATDLMKSHHLQCAVITVEPSGGDDTQAFIDAFSEAKLAGPGSTVKLQEGLYTIGMIEIRDFDGYLTGEGKGKTVITSLMEMDCDHFWDVENVMPSLLTFTGGSVVISHMTFHIPDGNPCQTGGLNDDFSGDLTCFIILSDYSQEYMPENRHITGVVDDVEFVPGDDGGYGLLGTPGNIWVSLYCGINIGMSMLDYQPPTNGNFTITNCYFENAGAGPNLFSLSRGNSVIIKNNIIKDCYQQIYLGNCQGGKVQVKNNTLSGAIVNDIAIDSWDFGLGMPGLLPLETINYDISGNSFDTPDGIVSIYIRDYLRMTDPVSVFPQVVDIKGNIFKTGEGGIAIQSLITNGNKIWNNKFLGEGSVGVMIDGDEASGTYAEGNMVLGNNFFGADYTDATVLLGSFSRNNKVVGVKSDLVIDEGVNNQVLGTNPHRSAFSSVNQVQNKFRLPRSGMPGSH